MAQVIRRPKHGCKCQDDENDVKQERIPRVIALRSRYQETWRCDALGIGDGMARRAWGYPLLWGHRSLRVHAQPNAAVKHFVLLSRDWIHVTMARQRVTAGSFNLNGTCRAQDGLHRTNPDEDSSCAVLIDGGNVLLDLSRGRRSAHRVRPIERKRLARGRRLGDRRRTLPVGTEELATQLCLVANQDPDGKQRDQQNPDEHESRSTASSLCRSAISRALDTDARCESKVSIARYPCVVQHRCSVQSEFWPVGKLLAPVERCVPCAGGRHVEFHRSLVAAPRSPRLAGLHEVVIGGALCMAQVQVVTPSGSPGDRRRAQAHSRDDRARDTARAAAQMDANRSRARKMRSWDQAKAGESGAAHELVARTAALLRAAGGR